MAASEATHSGTIGAKSFAPRPCRAISSTSSRCASCAPPLARVADECAAEDDAADEPLPTLTCERPVVDPSRTKVRPPTCVSRSASKLSSALLDGGWR
eukprot:6995118-Alexandrium_andersonii.AAC.1